MKKRLFALVIITLLSAFAFEITFASSQELSQENVIGFTGQDYFESVDLVLFPARAYSPELGRFLQRDPSGYVDGENLYEYVAGNPLSEVDELGLQAGAARGAGKASKRAAEIAARLAAKGADDARIVDDSVESLIRNAEEIMARLDQALNDIKLATKRASTAGTRGFYKYGDNPLAYYRENYAGVTRLELRKGAPGLYRRLLDEELIDEVPTVKRGRPPISREATLAEYRENYAGVTRLELRKAKPNLYRRLHKYGLIDEIPKAKGGPKPISREATLAEYRENYAGVTRLELRKANVGLYRRMLKFELIDEVPRAKKGRKQKYPDEIIEEALRRVNKGTSHSRVGKEMGIPQPTISAWVRNAKR